MYILPFFFSSFTSLRVSNDEDEMFYVLEGVVTIRCGGKTFEVEKGGVSFLPRGIKHGYTLQSDGVVRLLVITAPVREGMSGGWSGRN